MKQSGEIIKDLFVSILIVGCITLILSVIFYDNIATSRVIPYTEEYVPSNEMKKGLEDDAATDAKEVIINYYIDAADLKKYEKNNKYLNGKSNPFEKISTSVINNNILENNTNTGGFYNDNGTK